MSNASYLRLNLPLTATDCAVVRAAIRALHPDTLAVRSFREVRRVGPQRPVCHTAARQRPDRPAQSETSID